MLELRRRYSGVSAPSGSRLPNGYQEVEYIESTGEAYIVTNKLYSSIKKYALRTRFQITSRTNYGGIFNAGNLPSKFTFRLLQRGITGDSGYYAIPNSLSKTANFSITTTHGFDNIADVVLKEGFFQINNEQYTANTIIGEESIDECYFELFRNTDNNAYYYCRCKMYKLELDEDGITCLNLIPCYRTSDRVAGMYDIVNDVFYTNAGTGEFLVGPDVGGGQSSILPQEYQLVDYIETSGTEWIDTGKILHSNPRTNRELQVTIEGYMNPTDSTAEQYIFGCADGANYNQYIYIRKATRWEWKTAGWMYWDKRPTYSEWFKLVANTLDGCRVYDESNDLVDASSKGLESWEVHTNQSLYLFASHKSGDSASDFAFMKARHMKFEYINLERETVEVILDLYPCYRKADNVAGMYDLVEGKFHTNQGTGEFIVGPDIIG